MQVYVHFKDSTAVEQAKKIAGNSRWRPYQEGQEAVDLGDIFAPSRAGCFMKILDEMTERGLVSHFTLTDTVHAGFRPDGVYALYGVAGAEGSATLRVKTQIERHAANNMQVNDRSFVSCWQWIDARADTLAMLEEIYRRVRTGELPPQEDFTKGSINPLDAAVAFDDGLSSPFGHSTIDPVPL